MNEKAPCNSSIKTIALELDTDFSKGLCTHEARKQQQKYGKNEIIGVKGNSLTTILLRQFASPIILVLFFAGGISLLFQEWLDSIAIFIVILVNAFVGFYMEFQADRSMKALKKLTMMNAKVIRDGKLLEINSKNIVVGDIIFVDSGDMIPADARLGKVLNLQVNESALTGESVPVEKSEKTINHEQQMAEQTNMLFSGTFVTRGSAFAVVTAIGMDTELGKIAGMVSQAEQSATPLEKKLRSFTKKLIGVTFILVIVIFVLGWAMGQELFQMVRISIALAVASIPEGLPIVATLGLARGMLRMARHNVIVKKLSAIETLGSTNVICTDKTGTLTENKMKVQSIHSFPEGNKESLERMLQGFILCNNANIDNKDNDIGDPLETALLRYAEAFYNEKNLKPDFLKLCEESFTAESRRMVTVHKAAEGYFTFAKGAVEVVVEMSDKCFNGNLLLTEDQRKLILDDTSTLAASGFKVIAFAFRFDKDRVDEIPASGFHFLGTVALADPLRPEIGGAIEQCKSAGIRIVMITGDHPKTAMSIAKQLKLLDESDIVFTGSDMKNIKNLSEEEKLQWIDTPVFARVNPAQKLDLITVFQEYKYVVAMTGDGVNDAPALKKADIGIAMGQRGTQVAQDVADMILKDDSFSSIVSAVRQGRIIYENIRKFVIYLISSNLSEIVIIALAAVLNLPFIILPLQILFINIISDMLPALALGMTKASGSIMKEPPRSSKEPIIDKTRWKSIIFYAVVISIFSLGAVYSVDIFVEPERNTTAQLSNNILFFTLIFSQLLHVFNMNSSRSNFFTSEVMKNKYIWFSLLINVLIIVALFQSENIKEVLFIGFLSYKEWAIVFTFSFFSLFINLLAKVSGLIKH